jgi:ABC-type transport system substrate-binding protein
MKRLSGILVIALIFAAAYPIMRVSAAKGPIMDQLSVKFYNSGAAAFTALQNNEVDIIDSPLTYDQYQIAKEDPNIVVAPNFEYTMYDLALNNNYTASGVPGAGGYRNMFNYTEFRQAVALLTDKDGLLANLPIRGWGTRIDTMIPRPTMNNWVNFDYCKYGPDGEWLDNYPWDYDPTAAAVLLDSAGFIQGTTPNPYYNSSLSWSAQNIRVYPIGHEKAGADLDPTVFCIRSDSPGRLQLGRNVIEAMRLIGLPVKPLESHGIGTQVMLQYNYHIYTSGWSTGRAPLLFYYIFNPIGIYPSGPNYYLVSDPEMTFLTELLYPNATSIAMSEDAAMECQQLEVEKVYNIPVYSSNSYYAYRKGICEVTATRGYGLTENLDIPLMEAYHTDYPAVYTLRFGTKWVYTINPLFSSWAGEYNIIDRMFTSYLTLNPYGPTVLGKSPAGGDMPWMAYDWELDHLGPDGNARVTLWFRDDITWHDGTPFTVDDLNYTIFLSQYYDDSWGHANMIRIVNFVKLGDYTCRLYFDSPTIYNLYFPLYDIVPEHIYSQIPLPDPSDPNFYTYGHHGYWPGRDDPYVNGTICANPDVVWTGTNMWKYIAGSFYEYDGQISFEAYDDFWMSFKAGEVDFDYKWLPGVVPAGGSYAIGLTDLVLFAKAYGTRGDGAVPKIEPGEPGAWNPGADLAGPSGVVGLTDLVTLANAYGDTWGQNP